MPSRLELINALRVLAMDAVEKAQSGHPGAPMGMADMGEALWRGFMKHNPRNPTWADRDRFVLSNGHASMLLYGLLHLCGYDLGMEEIGRFRQLGSKTPGHPESRVTPGVEVTTGPLGQGVGMAVGLALAESLLARRFNREGFPVVDHRTWVFLGDGCLMEGVAQEACSLAGTLGLGKLTALYDDNGITIDGPVKGWFSDDTPARFEAMGWHVVRNVGGNDAADVDDALHEALAVTGKPSLICCKTVIGYGSPLKAGDASCHGAPLGADEASAARRRLGWNHEPFVIPEEYYAAWDCKARGEAAEAEWNALFAAYAEAYPDLAAEFRRRMDGSLPGDWAARCADMMRSARAGKSSATRVAGKHMLDAIAPLLPELVGGSADLSASNGTRHASAVTIGPEAMDGNYLEYGVREFGMGAIMNGLAAHGGFIPYGGTFLVFADYAKSAIRLAALMGKRVIWVLSHDSIGVGEDGPTHQPVEQLAALRLTPGVDLWRPCDNLESAVAWTAALERADGPTCLAMSRQNVPSQEHEAGQEDLIRRGGYVLRPARGEALALILASGSEVSLALQAAEELEAQGIGVQVVSMPCCEVFDRQDAAYRDSVLPPTLTRRLAVEAAAAGWWWKYVGLNGAILGMEGFGSSAPAGVLFEHFSFTVSCVVAKVKALLT